MDARMIYLDNAATSFPKPYAVTDAVREYMQNCGGNAGRGGYQSAMRAAESVYACRERLSNFFDAKNESVVFFTMNTTHGINACIKGFLHKGDRVLISNIEHNAVYRPIYKLFKAGAIDYDTFEIMRGEERLSDGEILENIKQKVSKNTTMLICTCASNICSVHPPIKKIGEFCRENGIFFLVDGAQGAGHIPISVRDSYIDALCVPAHKGLLGPQGCGAVILGDRVLLETLIEGGNGVDSLLGEMPIEPPERYEAGTLPIPAIVGLCEGLKRVEKIGLESIITQEKKLFERAKRMLMTIDGVRVYCPEESGAVILFSVDGEESEHTAQRLARAGICVRGGYHCAALAHRALGTEQGGAVRASFGIYNTDRDIDILCDSLRYY